MFGEKSMPLARLVAGVAAGIALIYGALAALGAAYTEPPIWSPDGTRIAFLSAVGGASDVYVVVADPTRPRRLTDERAIPSSLTWRPAP